MTKHVFMKWVCGLSAAVLLTATAWGSSISVRIPFSFIAAEQVFPAGNYQLTVIEGKNALRLEQRDGKEFAYLLFQRTNPKTEGRDHLSFSRYGSEYFLRGVNAAAIDVGCSIVKSKRERKLASELAKIFGKGDRAALPTRVQVAAIK